MPHRRFQRFALKSIRVPSCNIKLVHVRVISTELSVYGISLQYMGEKGEKSDNI